MNKAVGGGRRAATMGSADGDGEDRRDPGRRRQSRLPDRTRSSGAPPADRLGEGDRRRRIGRCRRQPLAAPRGADPRAAAVVTGSHMDTQPNGGRFDGIYGVIAGLEALTALHGSGTMLRRPIEVVAWTNEEGGRFAPGCMGSMAWSGFRRIEEFRRRRRSRRRALRRCARRASGRREPTCRIVLSAASRTPMSRRISSRDRGWKPRSSISASSPASRAAAGSP